MRHRLFPNRCLQHKIFAPFVQGFFLFCSSFVRGLSVFRSYLTFLPSLLVLPVGRGHCNKKGPPAGAPRTKVSRSAEDPSVGSPNTEAAPAFPGVR